MSGPRQYITRVKAFGSPQLQERSIPQKSIYAHPGWCRERSSNLDDAAANTDRQRMSPVVGPEFFHDVFDVRLHRFLGNE